MSGPVNEKWDWCLSFQLQASLTGRSYIFWPLSFSEISSFTRLPLRITFLFMLFFSSILLGLLFSATRFLFMFFFLYLLIPFHPSALHSGIPLLKTFSGFSHRLCQFFFACFDWQIILYIFVGVYYGNLLCV